MTVEDFTTKACSECGGIKSISEFSILKGRPRAACKRCHADRSREWRRSNHDKVLEQKRRAYYRDPQKRVAQIKQWRIENPEKYRDQCKSIYERRKQTMWADILERSKEYKRANREKYSDANRSYRANNKSRILAHVRAYQAKKRMAFPCWASIVEIIQFYEKARLLTEETGTPHEVDHIVPITSDIVCGLHVEFNLQVITRALNRGKHNRAWPYMPDLAAAA